MCLESREDSKVYAQSSIVVHIVFVILRSFLFFNETATTEIYTLSLHDALPIFRSISRWITASSSWKRFCLFVCRERVGMPRSEERFSRNAETDLVCRLLLEKKNNNHKPKLLTVAHYAKHHH